LFQAKSSPTDDEYRIDEEHHVEAPILDAKTSCQHTLRQVFAASSCLPGKIRYVARAATPAEMGESTLKEVPWAPFGTSRFAAATPPQTLCKGRGLLDRNLAAHPAFLRVADGINILRKDHVHR
jgi:hypothetical protein